jgi:hypothetical protein
MLYGVILLFIVGFLPKGVAGLKTWFVRA